ncbi:MAG: helicase HerA-like domain-containing protein, partial [Pseudomonadota bacterium]
PIDRESAYEVLKQRAEDLTEAAEQAAAQETEAKRRERIEIEEVRTRHAPSKGRRSTKSRSRRRQTSSEAFVKSAARQVGRELGRSLMRGILGSLRR